jgi:hypothetical protein
MGALIEVKGHKPQDLDPWPACCWRWRPVRAPTGWGLLLPLLPPCLPSPSLLIPCSTDTGVAPATCATASYHSLLPWQCLLGCYPLSTALRWHCDGSACSALTDGLGSAMAPQSRAPIGAVVFLRDFCVFRHFLLET